ncbi:MAG: hypothetical protein ACOZF0_17050 [Thermodesulfobacteriota bacterium]
MKIKLLLWSLLLIFITLSVASGIIFWNHEWVHERDVIYLVRGPSIIADKTWTGGKVVYYSKDGANSMLLREEVSQIVEGEYIERIKGSQIVEKTFRELVQTARQWSNRHHLPYNKAALAAVLLGIITLTVLFLFLRLRLRRKREVRDEIRLSENAPSSAQPTAKKPVVEDSDENQIVLFFLNLYRLQLAAPESAVVEFECLPSTLSEKNKVYELRVRQGGEYARRRMTIGPLGEESGSKSKCYYVIFDVHMVIKIPPKPLTDFNAYIENIRLEGEIVAKLLPRECIIPRVSVILRRIRQFHDEDTQPPEKIEDRYIRWLTNRTEAQQYLKIGKTFVFFMDLSKYFFLTHIIDNLHNLTDKTNDEILSYPDLIWDAPGFAGRYGQRNGAVCFRMQELYHVCEADLRRHMAQSDTSVIIPSYRIKGWFLSYLAGKESGVDQESDIAPQQKQLIHMRLKTILEEHAETVKEYRDVIRHQIQDVIFTRNKMQIASITVNLLELLAWLADRKVAMRDLKPDNLLVAGDRSQYPRFLSSPDQFSIGLIDVETAVYYGAAEHEIQQPQLGGTPFYATPAHLLENELLKLIYGDVKQALHLQDWQAVVGIIHKVVVGTPLFENSGKLLPAIRIHIQKRLAQKEEVSAIAMDINHMFWHSAEMEFETKVREHAVKLQAVLLKIGENSLGLLRNAVIANQYQIHTAIDQFIGSQRWFPGETNQRNLKRASHAHIVKLRERFEKQLKTRETEAANLQQVVNCLSSLGRLKSKQEELNRIAAILNETAPVLTARDVMLVLFHRVFYFMFKAEWDKSLVPEPFEAAAEAGETTYEATI